NGRPGVLCDIAACKPVYALEVHHRTRGYHAGVCSDRAALRGLCSAGSDAVGRVARVLAAALLTGAVGCNGKLPYAGQRRRLRLLRLLDLRQGYHLWFIRYVLYRLRFFRCFCRTAEVVAQHKGDEEGHQDEYR